MGSKEELIQPFVWYHLAGRVADYFVRCRAHSYCEEEPYHRIVDSYSNHRIAEEGVDMAQITCSGKFYLYSVAKQFHERVCGFFSRPTYLLPDTQICPLPIALAERLQSEYLDKGGKHGGGEVGRLPVMPYIEEWIKATKEKTTCRNYSPRQVGRMINRTSIRES
jgi:hypothetical protein